MTAPEECRVRIDRDIFTSARAHVSQKVVPYGSRVA